MLPLRQGAPRLAQAEGRLVTCRMPAYLGAECNYPVRRREQRRSVHLAQPLHTVAIRTWRLVRLCDGLGLASTVDSSIITLIGAPPENSTMGFQVLQRGCVTPALTALS
jgi:hypothetical protein